MIFVFQFTLLRGQPTVGVRNGKRVSGEVSLSLSTIKGKQKTRCQSDDDGDLSLTLELLRDKHQRFYFKKFPCIL